MMQRPSSRLLVLDEQGRVLLFRFEHKNGPLLGQVFWATPGGGVDAGESYEDAARRELFEEVGLAIEHPGPQIARRTASFVSPSGERVEADERYFVIHADRHVVVSTENWTDLEREVMAGHRWWSRSDLIDTSEQVWPEDLSDMLIGAGVWTPGLLGDPPERRPSIAATRAAYRCPTSPDCAIDSGDAETPARPCFPPSN